MRRSLSIGALVGALLTAPLIAVWHLGWTWFDFVFPPFDIFDRLTRALPAPVATIAIDTMVGLIGALRLNTADTAKIAEQSLAIAFAWAGGALASAVLFAGSTASGEPAGLPGAILGAILGGLVVLVEQSLNRLTSPGALVSGTWVLATFLAWGVATGVMCDRLRASRMADVDLERSTSRIDRRRVLGRLIGAARR